MSSRFSSTAIFLGLMASIMMSPSQAAKIYHWVDENGRSHYSENLPHNTEAKALSIKATGKGSAGSASTTRNKVIVIGGISRNAMAAKKNEPPQIIASTISKMALVKSILGAGAISINVQNGVKG